MSNSVATSSKKHEERISSLSFKNQIGASILAFTFNPKGLKRIPPDDATTPVLLDFTNNGLGWIKICGADGSTVVTGSEFTSGSVDPTGTILLKAGADFHIYPVGNDTFTEIGAIA